jgi:hypothetical protein
MVLKQMVKTNKSTELEEIDRNYKAYKALWEELYPAMQFNKKIEDHNARSWKAMTTKLKTRYNKEIKKGLNQINKELQQKLKGIETEKVLSSVNKNISQTLQGNKDSGEKDITQPIKNTVFKQLNLRPLTEIVESKLMSMQDVNVQPKQTKQIETVKASSKQTKETVKASSKQTKEKGKVGRPPGTGKVKSMVAVINKKTSKSK